MQITFHGAARTVTGSQHLFTVNGHQVLLDCGLYQGRRAEAYARNRHFPFSPHKLDAVVLSHAHIDHAGNLPNLAANGYDGPIHATEATRDLCATMLLDSAHIQEYDALFASRHRARAGETPVHPLYTLADAEYAVSLFTGHPYGTPFDVVPGMTATYSDAGHILGSAITVYDVQEEGRPPRRVCFTGDLGRTHLPILRDPQQVAEIDTLIIESTYGDRLHDPIVEGAQKLKDAVLEIVRTGGKIIIPAFAVGRTQEIVYALHQLVDSGEIPRIPVFVDSPLALDATSVFRAHPECYDEETRAFLMETKHTDPLGFESLTYVRSVEESKSLNRRHGPFIIISASGMAENGRILHHLRNNVNDPHNIILLVGWAAPDTLARKLMDGWKVVRIFGEEHRVRAQVRTLHGFSAHADRAGLLDYVRALGARLRQVFLVHGELGPAEALAAGIRELGVPHVHVPTLHETVEVL